MIKKEYQKPTMRVVKIQHQHIICTSPGGYNNQGLQMRSGTPDDQIDNEEYVW